ncbi:hypothetical protein D6D15_08461 [Aureobasidium pullulans]|uniref:DUF1763-domain-containing protein n=1 Tax=Aureobasidium pullulans TaxID=5580 RepID=A0A4S9AXW4_AURPU|nr:hypothetical protein D6D15_08461 [Aureobasidium pullulans]
MSLEILHAYRHLLRTSLHAIRHAKPARYTLLTHLRHCFRSTPQPFSASSSSSYDAPTTTRTLEFLTNAVKYKGVEEKVVRNLIHVWGCRGRDVPSILRKDVKDMRFRDEAYEKFDEDVRMLERTLGIRLTGGEDMGYQMEVRKRYRRISQSVAASRKR